MITYIINNAIHRDKIAMNKSEHKPNPLMFHTHSYRFILFKLLLYK